MKLAILTFTKLRKPHPVKLAIQWNIETSHFNIYQVKEATSSETSHFNIYQVKEATSSEISHFNIYQVKEATSSETCHLPS